MPPPLETRAEIRIHPCMGEGMHLERCKMLKMRVANVCALSIHAGRLFFGHRRKRMTGV